MYDAQARPARAMDGPQVEVDWDRIRQRCESLFGSRTNIQCAVAMGIAPRTLDYFRQNPATSTLRVAFQIQAATGLTLDEMFRPAAAFEQAA